MDKVIKCSCGKVSGIARNLSASTTNHLMCSCVSCQTYAHYLGRAPDMLNDKGASHIFQMDPKYFEIDAGLDHVACMSVTPDGPLRWYADCCKTPLGNSFRRAGTPFLGVLPICIGEDGPSGGLDKIVGPSRAHANRLGPTTFGEKFQFTVMLARFIYKLLQWRIVGGRSVKPFFDAETGLPIKKPIKLTPDELHKIQSDAGLL